jgi:hypothetical protein
MENIMFQKLNDWWNGTKQAAKGAAVDVVVKKAEDVAVDAAVDAVEPAADKAQAGITSFLASIKTKAKANPVPTVLAFAATGVVAVFALGQANPQVKEISSSILESIFSAIGKFAKKVLESFSTRAADAAKSM